MAAQRFLEIIAEQPSIENMFNEIMIIGDEGQAAYDRVNILNELHTNDPHALGFTPPAFQGSLNVSYMLNNKAVALDLQHDQVILRDNTVLGYDSLVLATGADAVFPPIPQAKAAGCFSLRTLADVRAIRAHTATSDNAIIVGGGLLGIEAAKHFHQIRKKVSLIECGPYLMPLQMDSEGAKIITHVLQSMNVDVFTNTLVEEVLVTGPRATGVRLSSGATLSSDFILFATGIRPRDALAREAGLAVAPKGGIIVDNYCRTSKPNVYAIGDCALMNNLVYGLIAPAYLMAEAVAKGLSRNQTQKVELPPFCAKLKFEHCDTVSFGDSRGVTPGAKVAVMSLPAQNLYRKLVTNSQGTKLLGGILVGDTSKYSDLLHYMNSQLSIGDNLFKLLTPTQPEQQSPSPASSTPDDAIICSCRSIRKRDIIRAVHEEGCVEIGQIKLKTKAGTGCGGCLPAISEVLAQELKKKGVAVRNMICEHFAMTRKELFALIQQHKHRSFDTVLAQHGKGEGCEICKPLVASILASLWGDHILEAGLVSLQDTNDAFLANVQKDGTYSVVPRMPGGEISAEKLGVVAAIGEKYGLYTKITGGQRVDMFGASIDKLPDIWRDLVAHGFESGHAYGKSLRTVKSCVGQRWCRFGVQDSTWMAIELEHRYRGLRSPHKLKSGVSGCTRECAEAQSKDFGVIATQKGWNLYVCGNGGIKPQHAVLLAADLDATTLFKYIDRFLMFYIRTADRLERTATWLNNLSGGIDYLRKVVIEDCLGIGEQLERDLERLRAGYKCEWAETLNNPQKLKRFKTFVNAAPDAAATPATHGSWLDVCHVHDIEVNTGMCALVGTNHVALFRVRPQGASEEKIYAIDNYDPVSHLSILSRGLVGDKDGVLKVTSPIYKDSYALKTGSCLNNPSVAALRTYKTRVNGERIEVWTD
jgi:nitrite reductase (NADH) large subunit